MKPFFSIGVTTYDRFDLLKETISSILSQSFGDFELLVGNDNTERIIDATSLGFEDERIRYINHHQNLGWIGNMNYMLNVSNGRYFTWLGDDDMYAPTFLEMIRLALDKYDFSPCVFTSYMQGPSLPERLKEVEADIQVFDRRQFLQKYLSRQLKALGCYGVFDRQYIRQLGGIEQLGNGFSPYSDSLLAIKASLQKRVVYINTPLIFFRTHDQSISWVSPDVDAYSSAQKDLLSKSLEIFASEGLNDDFHSNLFLLLKWCLSNYCTVMRRSGSLQFGKLIRYLLFLMSYLKELKGHRREMMVVILRSTYKLMVQMAKESFKNKNVLNFQEV
jgi:glycosyltransferase involved in cell wall biosynthesis